MLWVILLLPKLVGNGNGASGIIYGFFLFFFSTQMFDATVPNHPSAAAVKAKSRRRRKPEDCGSERAPPLHFTVRRKYLRLSNVPCGICFVLPFQSGLAEYGFGM